MEGFKDVFGRKLNWIFLFRFHEVKVKPKLKLKPGPIWSNELSFFSYFLRECVNTIAFLFSISCYIPFLFLYLFIQCYIIQSILHTLLM